MNKMSYLQLSRYAKMNIDSEIKLSLSKDEIDILSSTNPKDVFHEFYIRKDTKERIFDKSEAKRIAKSGIKIRTIKHYDKKFNQVLSNISKRIDFEQENFFGFKKKTHIGNAMYEVVKNPELAKIKVDLSNAFEQINKNWSLYILKLVFNMGKEEALLLNKWLNPEGHLFQGNPLSPSLFNVAISPFVRNLSKYFKCKVISYADDITILKEGTISKKAIQAIAKIAEQCQLVCNKEKTKICRNRCNFLGLQFIKNQKVVSIKHKKLKKKVHKLDYVIKKYFKQKGQIGREEIIGDYNGFKGWLNFPFLYLKEKEYKFKKFSNAFRTIKSRLVKKAKKEYIAMLGNEAAIYSLQSETFKKTLKEKLSRIRKQEYKHLLEDFLGLVV